VANTLSCLDVRALLYQWNESRRRGWLTVSAGNNINGDSVMELEPAQLKDMGVKKIGDRIRISTQSKQLRNKEYQRTSKSRTNRV
jgi:hypothetical protein